MTTAIPAQAPAAIGGHTHPHPSPEAPMPFRDPAAWQQLFDSLPEPVRAAILSVLVAWLRIMYDDREPRMLRRALEAALCGAITLGIGSGAEALGAGAGMAMFIGGTIGLYGADAVREVGKRYLRRRLDQR